MLFGFFGGGVGVGELSFKLGKACNMLHALTECWFQIVFSQLFIKIHILQDFMPGIKILAHSDLSFSWCLLLMPGR